MDVDFFNQPTTVSVATHHAVIATKNTIYYVSGNRCVAVKSRVTNRFVDEHTVLGARFAGFVFAKSVHGPFMCLPYPMSGCRLRFTVAGEQILSSQVTDISPLR